MTESYSVNGKSSRKITWTRHNYYMLFGVISISLIAICIGLAIGIPLSSRRSSDPVVQTVHNVLQQYPLIDGHNDLPWQYRQYAKNKVYDVNLREDTRVQWPDTLPMDNVDFPRISPATDIPRLKKGMVGAQFWASFASCSSTGRDAVRIGMEQVDVIHKIINKYDDTFELVTTAQGILDAYLIRNKIASLIGLEGGHMIGNTLGILRSYYSLGVRYMTLTHSCDTSWAGLWSEVISSEVSYINTNYVFSCVWYILKLDQMYIKRHRKKERVKLYKTGITMITDNKNTGKIIIKADNWLRDQNKSGSKLGLSDFGKIVIKEMNRLGMMVDLSHVSKQTMIDAIETSIAPVIFSHSAAFAKCQHYRNVQDDVLKMVKANNGIVMVNFYPPYISKGCLPRNATEALLTHVTDHINYIKDLIGIDYVGIGSDFDGIPSYATGLEDVSKYPELFTELHRQGWTPDELQKLAGENFIRVFRKVEKIKQQLREIQPYEDVMPENEAVPDRNCYTSF